MTTEAANPASDIFTMSDDEILNMAAPTAEVEPAPQNNPEDDNPAPAPEEVVVTPADEPNEPEPAPVEEPEPANTSNQPEDGATVVDTQVDSNGKPITDAVSDSQVPGQVVENKDKQSEGLPTDFDYKAGYEQLMAPFKANGKTITPRNAEEVVSLMQMGANYTRKMQELQPFRKVMLMLQNNNLMDEGKLSYLIDLDKKNPEAIKQLIKDSGLDVLDINPDEAINYQAGNHKVTDAEAAFATELDDLKSTPEGQATLGAISQTWDTASKEELFNNPGLTQIIHTQRQNGIYDRIVSEIEHQRTLGHLPAGIPFLSAYNQVGNMLASNNGFADLVKQPEPKPQVIAPVVTRVVQPKPTVANTQQASAASTTRASNAKAASIVNPLEMSDEDFAKLPIPGRY